MISAREFCRERGFPHSVFLTYAFDPLFFERVPLRDLDKGGNRNVVIAADAGQLRDAMRQSIQQLVHLGRSYVLAETIRANVFHPKLIARLSPSGGRVWIGSGNLTYTGWGGNQELATAWSLGPQEEDSGSWLSDLFDAVSGVVRSTTFTAQIDTIRHRVPWLSAKSPTSSASVLFSTPTLPLAPQLAARWSGRTFDELKLCTGSTDTEGAFLLWAHRTFGVKRATICLSPPFAAFDPRKLAKLPLDIRIIKAQPERLMHAKFYWFSGSDSVAALIGSANCSAAAWLAGGGNGNVELVVPYDSPRPNDFKHVLSIFKGKTLTLDKALSGQSPEPEEDEQDDELSFEIVSLRLRATGRIVEIILEPQVPPGHQVEVVLSSTFRKIPVALTLRGAIWTGRLPPDFELGPGTAYGSAIIKGNGEIITTSPRWLDNEAVIAHSTAEMQINPSLGDLSRRSFATTDQQRIFEAIQAVSNSLLRGDGKAVVTAATRRIDSADNSRSDGEEPQSGAVDPAAIIRSLKELASARAARNLGATGTYSGTLEGVIAMLFSRDETRDEIDLSHEAWTGDNPEQASDEPGDVKGNLGQTSGNDPLTGLPDCHEVAARFREQLEKFLRELATSEFADTCDVARMVQSLAFPLLLCVRGKEGGWLPRAMLASVATRVVEIMFAKSYGADKARGLFRRVRERYVSLGREDEFSRAVGEGTLWSALLSSLCFADDESFKFILPQAAALTATFNCKELIAFTAPEHLESLLQGLIIPDSELAMADRVTKVVAAFGSAIAALQVSEPEIYELQGNGRRPQRGGSLLWSSKWGWHVLPLWPAETYCSDYINIDLAAADYPQIAEALLALRSALLITSSDPDLSRQ